MAIVKYSEGLKFYYDEVLIDFMKVIKDGVLNKNLSTVFVVDGRSGKGKSTLSCQVAKYLNPDFTIDNIYFEAQPFLEGLSKAKKGDVLIFDEAMMLSSRSALSRMNKLIVMAMSLIRSKNIFIIFNITSIFDLDKNLALDRADLLLHVYGTSWSDRGKFMMFFKSSGDNFDRIKSLYIAGKKYYSYKHPKANHFSTFSKEFIVDEKEYDRRKQLAVTRILRQDQTTRTPVNRDVLVKKAKKIGITIKHICQLFEIGRTTVYDIDKRISDEDMKLFSKQEQENKVSNNTKQ